MQSITVIEIQIHAVLAAMKQARFEDVVNGLATLAMRHPDWAKGAKQAALLTRLEQKWTNTVGEIELAEEDLQDARYLLFTVPSDLKLTNAKDAEITTMLFADELRFAAIAIAAMTLKAQRVEFLLRNQLRDSELLDAVFNEAVWVKTGVEVSCKGLLSVDRKFVELVLDLLDRRLQEYPVDSILIESNIETLRFALIAALAREGAMISQRQQSS